jgi:hypothetical protein
MGRNANAVVPCRVIVSTYKVLDINKASNVCHDDTLRGTLQRASATQAQGDYEFKAWIPHRQTDDATTNRAQATQERRKHGHKAHVQATQDILAVV